MKSPAARDDLLAVFDRLLGADVDDAVDADLVDLVAGAQRVRSWLDAFDMRCLNRNRDLHPTISDRAGRERDRSLFTGPGRRSGRDARDTADRADTCERIPELGRALSDGEATAAHLDAVHRATAGVDDATRTKLAEHGDELAAAAREQSPEELGRTCQDLIRRLADDDGAARQARLRAQRRCTRRTDRDTGMDLTTLSLDPLTADRVWTAIRAAIASAHAQRQPDDDRTWEQFVADVVVDLITGTITVGGTGRPEIVVLVDLDTLQHGPHPDTTCETSSGSPVPVCTLRRLLCDADILPVTLDGDGTVLDVGRSSRTATAAQRTALRAMYPTCAFPGCTVGFDDCRIHHVVFWRNHGRTDLHNLLPVCEHHHHLVHEGGWALTISKGRTLTIFRPDGSRHFYGTTHRRPRPKPCRRPKATEPLRHDEPAHDEPQPAAATGPRENRPVPDAAAAGEPAAPPRASTPHTDPAATPADLLDPTLEAGADETSAADDVGRPDHIQAVVDLAQRAAERAAERARHRTLHDTG